MRHTVKSASLIEVSQDASIFSCAFFSSLLSLRLYNVFFFSLFHHCLSPCVHSIFLFSSRDSFVIPAPKTLLRGREEDMKEEDGRKHREWRRREVRKEANDALHCSSLLPLNPMGIRVIAHLDWHLDETRAAFIRWKVFITMKTRSSLLWTLPPKTFQ